MFSFCDCSLMAETTLLLMKAPLMPLRRIPRAIKSTESGSMPGHGPDSMSEIKKRKAPAVTILVKFLFYSATKLSAKDVMI